jgi:hypothetical protein
MRTESLIERRRALHWRSDAGRQNTDDHRVHPVLFDGLTDHRPIAAEPILPKSVGQDQTRRGRFIVRQQSTEQRFESEHRHQIRRDPVDAGGFGFAVERQNSVPLLKRGDALEHGALALPVQHVQPELRESVRPRLGLTEAIRTSRSGLRYGSGRSNTALTTLKIAVLAPMPNASVSTATAVKPGFFSNWRKAKRRSFMAVGKLRIENLELRH